MNLLSRLDTIDGRSLSLLQRLLLANDGTLTEALEAAFLEPIELVKVSMKHLAASDAPARLESETGIAAMQRQILLKGSTTRRNFVFAESWIALDRLPAPMRTALTESDRPIGRLWREHKLETRKELLRFWRQPGGDLSSHFGLSADSPFLAREYTVFLDQAPLMIISEYFPAGLGD